MASFADKPILEPTIAEWTAFLEDAPSPEGVRLKLRKKLSKAPGITWSEALDVALCFGWIDGQSLRLDNDYTLQAFTPRRKNSPWSQVNRDHVARLIADGTMRAGGLAEVERAEADGRWDAAYSQKNMTTPPDLQAALDANPASAEFHASLTRSVRFQICARLTGIKTPAVRAARIRDVVERGAVGEHHYAQPKPRP
ncbi:bacteriocin-protection protein, YdeI/OmpD-associated family [Salinibacterium sp. UTAS2018]|uniref:YdeI/OmpD-associated family protein n=1 Tax=Salinibacterium sp. UTAS2018 TaxID=2508880 RepID=UPI0010094568|nr:YdeI/OmpD-associated family protein [Salinibacterium sp. UTAS2018]QAV70084.1 bacteriocin-protection protein, YdeI/OmpD-associated family [Salinibacterium sp. UTAS2018]